MFKFTIRELMLVTAIVGLVTGWIVRERSLAIELAKCARWRDGAAALTSAVREEGWEVGWRKDHAVWIKKPDDVGCYYVLDGWANDLPDF